MGYPYSEASVTRPVLAHKKAWQRIEDSLVELTQERMISLRESSKLTAYTKDGRYMKDNKLIGKLRPTTS